METIIAGEVSDEAGEAGRYGAEIDKIGVTKSGKAVQITYKSSETGESLCNDFIALSEKARFILSKKMKVLGCKKDEDGAYLINDDLIGKRVFLHLINDADKPQYLTPNFEAPNHGYEPDDDVNF